MWKIRLEVEKRELEIFPVLIMGWQRETQMSVCRAEAGGCRSRRGIAVYRRDQYVCVRVCAYGHVWETHRWRVQICGESGMLRGLLGPYQQGAQRRLGQITQGLSEPSVSSVLFWKLGMLSHKVQYLSNWQKWEQPCLSDLSIGSELSKVLAQQLRRAKRGYVLMLVPWGHHHVSRVFRF